MSVKALLLVGSGVVLLGIAAFLVYYLRQAAAEAEVSNQRMRAISDCATQLDRAARLVAERDPEKAAESRVAESASHYNQQLRQCYVEVTTQKRGESPSSMKTLISISENSVILWSMTGQSADSGRRCFGADAMPVDCAKADQQWKAYMGN